MYTCILSVRLSTTVKKHRQEPVTAEDAYMYSLRPSINNNEKQRQETVTVLLRLSIINSEKTKTGNSYCRGCTHVFSPSVHQQLKDRKQYLEVHTCILCLSIINSEKTKTERIHVCILYSNCFLSLFFIVVDGRTERIHVCILCSNWFLSMFFHCC